MTFGFPIKVNKDRTDPESEIIQYESLLDKKLDQLKYVGDFQYDIYEFLEENYEGDEFYSTALSYELVNKQFQNMANDDVSWAIFSILFVIIYFVFHLRSAFLALNSIGLILFCFPVTALINMGIF